MEQDIVLRLREAADAQLAETEMNRLLPANPIPYYTVHLCRDAADEIVRLRAFEKGVMSGVVFILKETVDDGRAGD